MKESLYSFFQLNTSSTYLEYDRYYIVKIILNKWKNIHWHMKCFYVFEPPTAVFWRRQWHPTPVLLPGKSHGWRSLEGCSPWGRWGSDTTERLHFHFSLSCIGEGNGNPLQCSCLENPRDRGAWWAAVYGVAQSRTRLKWLSIAQHSILLYFIFTYISHFPSLCAQFKCVKYHQSSFLCVIQKCYLFC